MKGLFVVSIVALFLFLAGCVGTQGTLGTQGTEGTQGVQSQEETQQETQVQEETQQQTEQTETTAGMSDWCEAGASYSTYGGAEGYEMKIIGLTTYKGKQMCHASAKATDESGTTTIEYYYDEEGTDIWYVVTGPEGQTQEMHITG